MFMQIEFVMKGFFAVLLFMAIILVMFSLTLPVPSQPLSYRITAELRNLKYLR